ncbi:MAG: FtsX-like permease family protein, partial [Myxococcota bacterium]
EREDQVSEIEKRVVEGRFLRTGQVREILIGRRAADSLDVEVGDEVLLYGIAYSLESAYELFRVVGLIHFPDPNLERSLAFISLEDAQSFYVYPEHITEVAVLLGESDDVPLARAALLENLHGQNVRVHPWQSVVPELEQYVLLDKGGMYVILVLLVVVVGFGILNTILMAVLERKREFGILLALGLKPGQVFRIVYLESLLLAAVGIAIGLAVALPIVLYFQANPIPLSGEIAEAAGQFGVEPVIVWKLKTSNPIGSSLVMLGVALLAAFYPAVKASRGQPIDVVQNV